MTLGTLVLYIAIVALILTVFVGIFMRGHKNWLMTYLQNFCGSLFVFSGWVKAVDPLGTAYKMEQYFAEFEATFAETWMSFIAPLFPWLSEHSVIVSVIMIVFEIVLGLMLLLGSKTKFASWAFLLLVGFFTFLTGFTYLTGYVPNDVNFFEFGKWGPYVETNMKVTDCGCFGDFLKLKPKISFFKDVFLLIPAFFFVFRHKDMHQLFTPKIRKAIGWVSMIGLTVYCLSNYVWDIPHADFRPFRVGANIGIQKALETTAEANVPILAYQLTNKNTGEVKDVPYNQYLKEFKQYPREEWDAEQVKGDPTLTIVKDANGNASVLNFYAEIPANLLSNFLNANYDLDGDTTVIMVETTKITDFDISDIDGNEVTSELVSNPDYSFMVVAYKLKYDASSATRVVNDTSFVYDTIQVNVDSSYIEKKVGEINSREISTNVYTFDEDYVKRWSEVTNPVMNAAQAVGLEVNALTAFADPGLIDDFRHETQSAYPFHVSDDILLKTIVRSNPGVVLLKHGEVIAKWHYTKLPSFEEIQAEYMK